jgi:hypothetical protein
MVQDGNSPLRQRPKHRRKGRRTEAAFKPIASDTARIVVQWYRDSGLSRVETTRRTGLRAQMVGLWWNRDQSITQPGRGPERLINRKGAFKLKKAIIKIRFMTPSKVATKVKNPRTGKKVNSRTISRAIKSVGAVNKRVRKGSMLTPRNKMRRFNWCQAHLDSGTDFRHWDFSDEKWWCVGGVQGNERLWVDADEPAPDELWVSTVAHPTKIHVWGAISYNGRSSLHIHNGRVNSKAYQECLDQAYKPAIYHPAYLKHKRGDPVTFQQDGASCHMSKATCAWLQKDLPTSFDCTYETGMLPVRALFHLCCVLCAVCLLWCCAGCSAGCAENWRWCRMLIVQSGEDGWPASSPDLSIIERLWAILQDRVIERRAYSEADLTRVVVEEWWNIDQDVIRKLYDGIPVRLQKCVNSDGGRFKI